MQRQPSNTKEMREMRDDLISNSDNILNEIAAGASIADTPEVKELLEQVTNIGTKLKLNETRKGESKWKRRLRKLAPFDALGKAEEHVAKADFSSSDLKTQNETLLNTLTKQRERVEETVCSIIDLGQSFGENISKLSAFVEGVDESLNDDITESERFSREVLAKETREYIAILQEQEKQVVDIVKTGRVVVSQLSSAQPILRSQLNGGAIALKAIQDVAELSETYKVLEDLSTSMRETTRERILVVQRDAIRRHIGDDESVKKIEASVKRQNEISSEIATLHADLKQSMGQRHDILKKVVEDGLNGGEDHSKYLSESKDGIRF